MFLWNSRSLSPSYQNLRSTQWLYQYFQSNILFVVYYVFLLSIENSPRKWKSSVKTHSSTKADEKTNREKLPCKKKFKLFLSLSNPNQRGCIQKFLLKPSLVETFDWMIENKEVPVFNYNMIARI